MSESGFANRENGDYIRYILGERTSRGDRVVNGNGKIEWGSEITRTDSEDIANGSGEKRIKNTNDSDGSFSFLRNKHDNETIKDNSFIPEEAKPDWYKLTETSTDEGEQINEIPNPNRWLEASTSFQPEYSNFSF